MSTRFKKLATGALPETGFVRQAQLIPAILPISSATLWRRVVSGDFPKPVKLSARVTAWKVEEVRAWIAKRSASPNSNGKYAVRKLEVARPGCDVDTQAHTNEWK